MSETAARLQSHNQEMVKCIDLLRQTQTALEDRIAIQEKKKDTLEQEMENLQRTLDQLESSIADDTKKLNDCSRRLTETENGYAKVVDTLQLLLLSAKEKPTKNASEATASGKHRAEKL